MDFLIMLSLILSVCAIWGATEKTMDPQRQLNKLRAKFVEIDMESTAKRRFSLNVLEDVGESRIWVNYWFSGRSGADSAFMLYQDKISKGSAVNALVFDHNLKRVVHGPVNEIGVEKDGSLTYTV